MEAGRGERRILVLSMLPTQGIGIRHAQPAHKFAVTHHEQCRQALGLRTGGAENRNPRPHIVSGGPALGKGRAALLPLYAWWTFPLVPRLQRGNRRLHVDCPAGARFPIASGR